MLLHYHGIFQEHQADGDQAAARPDHSETPPAMQNEMADKLDILMNMMLEYIQTNCYSEGITAFKNASIAA